MRYKILITSSLLLTLILCTASFRGKKRQNLPEFFKKDFCFVPDSAYLELSSHSFRKGFFMGKREVSVKEYLLFLNDLDQYPFIEKSQVQPDTSLWRQSISFPGKLPELYYSHPAYRNHPMVGISQEACLLYCFWLEEKLNQQMPKPLKLIVRLPTKEEWLRAALLDSCTDAVLDSKRKIYELALSGELGNLKGMCAASGKGKKGKRVDQFPFQSPCASFDANHWGLHDLFGNVAEFCQEQDLALGFSWNEELDQLLYKERSAKASAEIGFRVMVKIGIHSLFP